MQILIPFARIEPKFYTYQWGSFNKNNCPCMRMIFPPGANDRAIDSLPWSINTGLA